MDDTPQSKDELLAELMATRQRVAQLEAQVAAHQQVEAELRESENRFAVVFNESSDIQLLSTVESDGTFRIVAVNRQYREGTERVYSISEQDIVGKTLRELARDVLGFDETVVAYTIEGYQRAVESGEPVRFEEALDTPHGKLHTEAVIAPIFGASNTPHYILYSARDITKRKAAEQQQLELVREIERKDALRMLIGNISHDIKTPLAIINTSLYLLEKHTDPQKRQEKTDNIRTQVHKLESFIQDLMILSRLDGEPALRLTLVDLNEMAISIENALQPMTEQKHNEFILDLSENIPQIQADQGDLRRAITNLVENAIQYTPEGRSVRLRTYRQAESVAVEIQDNGIGISQDDLPHIFDRFFRSTQAQAITLDGSGLGLAIAKRVIEMHGGSIDVESEPGAGSTFLIQLPVAG